MADFLSIEWFESLNDTLRAAGPVPRPRDAPAYRVVLEFSGAPAATPHALTFTLSDATAAVSPGDHLAADAIVRLTYADALALTNGTLDSASALREGRLKIRGDVHTIVPLLSWLQQAQPRTDPT